jgi:hypothetical protein
MDNKKIIDYIEHFTDIYENEVEIAPIPDGVKVVVYLADWNYQFIIPDAIKRELGREVVLAKKWILQSKLEILMKAN